MKWKRCKDVVVEYDQPYLVAGIGELPSKAASRIIYYAGERWEPELWVAGPINVSNMFEYSLKPCPFCGSQLLYFDKSNVECGLCHAKAPTLSLWNRRESNA